MLDFDKIDEWAPIMGAVLEGVVPIAARSKLAEVKLRFVEDARELLFAICDREAIVDRMLLWVQASTIVGFHGTRLTDSEVMSVQSRGLLKLKAESRRLRLERALSSHPRWPEVAPRLAAAIRKHGPGACTGRREGEAHLTLSRSSLVKGSNHYIVYGAEFDQNVACSLLGSDGEELLAADGLPRLVLVAVPGEAALNACHRFRSMYEMRERGDVPNMVREFITAWAYRLACPAASRGPYYPDCGMVFEANISPEWLLEIETLHGPSSEQRS